MIKHEIIDKMTKAAMNKIEEENLVAEHHTFRTGLEAALAELLENHSEVTEEWAAEIDGESIPIPCGPHRGETPEDAERRAHRHVDRFGGVVQRYLNIRVRGVA